MSETANRNIRTNRGATRALLAGRTLFVGVVVPFLGYVTLLGSHENNVRSRAINRVRRTDGICDRQECTRWRNRRAISILAVLRACVHSRRRCVWRYCCELVPAPCAAASIGDF